MVFNIDFVWLFLVFVAFNCCFSVVDVAGKSVNHNRRRGGGGGPGGLTRSQQMSVNTKSSHLHQEKGKICIGTNGRMSVPSNRDHHYRNLKDRYTNCTYVDGNLELTWLQDGHLDLSFLKDIREVTGYVLISHVDLKRIVLPRLQIIRGRTLFKMNVRKEEFALLISLNKMFSIEMPLLRDVLTGSVGLFNNYNLCHVKTINWKEIMTDPIAKQVYVYNFTAKERECEPCHKSCEHGCWGEGKENCQQFSKENCSPQCDQGRCFGPNPRECCHLFCAGGCTGPKQSDCIACRNFYDDGVCTQECPPMQIYDQISYKWVENPRGKYAYGATCVKNCPEHLLKDNGACVRTCPPDKKAHEGACVPCDGPCPKTCTVDTSIHAGNIESFRGCTVIEGNLVILQNTFEGFQHIYSNYTFGERYPPMHPNRLQVFETLKEVTGYINIQAYHKDFTNLTYFRNLEVIGGRTLYEYFTSLYIVKTSLRSLDLRSLKRLNSGTIAILENKHLCFADDINWDRIRKSNTNSVMLSNNSDPKACLEAGLVCDGQCSRDGCWANGSDQCLSCTHFHLSGKCIANCSVLLDIYQASNNECKPCHSECAKSCRGPGPEHCTACKHMKDGPFCVANCTGDKYEENGECKKCHENCVDGCTGPANTIGPGACNSCNKAIMNENATVDYCLSEDDACPDGYYNEWMGPQEQHSLRPLQGKRICRKCHPRCKKCTGYGFHELVCQQCTHYKHKEQCEDECPVDFFPDNENQICKACDQECKGCSGPGPGHCTSCQNFKIYDDIDTNNSINNHIDEDIGTIMHNASFYCASTCPTEIPFRIFPENLESAYCSPIARASASSSMSAESQTSIWIGTTIGVLLIIILVIVAFLTYVACKRVKAKEKTLKITMALTGIGEEPHNGRTNVQPNVAQLRIIKETEIRKGDVLGYGAFGTVYKGVWVLEGENSSKIPVAIKVLRDDAGANNSKEFLSEAYIMASVDHPNLLQLLAVCMTSKMMLITQLMPLGCLLDFVRKNRDRIGGKALLNWCGQIARGMAYLEEKRLVHRDLAARNVLVQTPACVKITDFGLAKLLDINEEEYKAEGGKMPIKWLALECIQHRIFTHKSDVWAFGVTVWELLTFGGRPYDNVSARDVPELLERGKRLPQPAIATIDIYMIMVNCWMLDAESRPSFEELADDFTKKSQDPGRYLVIPGDGFRRTLTQNDREAMRTLANTLETSVSQMDEYLAPKSRAPLQGAALASFAHSLSQASISNPYNWHNSHPSNPPTTITTITTTSDGSSCHAADEDNAHNAAVAAAAAAAAAASVLNHHPCTSATNSSDGYDSGRSQAQLGSLKLDLPVDEDDYLMPSPHGTAYVDLINGAKGGVCGVGSGSVMSSDFYKNTIDNPEYLMGSNSVLPTAVQTLGVPYISSSNGGLGESVGGHFQRHQLQPRNSEEESDHEYYNDFDSRLQRELQPLQKTKDGAAVV